MMSDIVERLRDYYELCGGASGLDVCLEAADEIEKLRKGADALTAVISEHRDLLRRLRTRIADLEKRIGATDERIN
jgi:phage shock protein A